MDITKRRPETSIDDLKKQIPVITNGEQIESVVAKALKPMIDDLKALLVEIMPVIPDQLDGNELVDNFKRSVEKSLVVNTENVIQEAKIPDEVVQLLELQGRSIAILKNRIEVKPDPVITLENYKPHDQDQVTAKALKISWFGFVDPNGKWYILCQNGRDHTQRYAAGINDYREAWITRQEQKYDYLNEAFNGE